MSLKFICSDSFSDYERIKKAPHVVFLWYIMHKGMAKMEHDNIQNIRFL